jgi:hypothetical protein
MENNNNELFDSLKEIFDSYPNCLYGKEQPNAFVDIKLSQSEVEQANEVFAGDDIPDLNKDSWDKAKGYQTEVINKRLVEDCLIKYAEQGTYTIFKLAHDLGLSEDCISKLTFENKTW